MSQVARKVTVEINADLLDKAMDQTQKGLTETIRQGLILLAESRTYGNIKKLKGKGAFGLDWKKLKEDR